jgi:hypothetical protein
MIKLILKYLLICSLNILLTQCNYRTSSQKRFSNILDIEIPKDAEILKDEYQDMGQDFVIVYELKLNKKQMTDLTHSIRNSKYYNPSAFITNYLQQDMFLGQGDLRAVWAKTDSGYLFQNDFDRDSYSAKIDTVNLTAKFNELHD